MGVCCRRVCVCAWVSWAVGAVVVVVVMWCVEGEGGVEVVVVVLS